MFIIIFFDYLFSWFALLVPKQKRQIDGINKFFEVVNIQFLGNVSFQVQLFCNTLEQLLLAKNWRERPRFDEIAIVRFLKKIAYSKQRIYWSLSVEHFLY